MLSLCITQSFCAAHFIPNAGKCAALHGHNYTVEWTITARYVNDSGFIVDASAFKQLVAPLIAKLDHSTLNDLMDSHLPPSTEVMCNYIAEWTKAKLWEAMPTVTLAQVELQETPTIKAKWTPDV